MNELAHHLDQERRKLRRAALLALLYQAFPRPMGFGLLAQSLPEDVSCAASVLDLDLDYLAKSGLIETRQRPDGGASQHRITAAGCDRVESGSGWDDAARRAVRMLRLRVLEILHYGRPRPVGIPLLRRALSEDQDLDLSEESLNRATAYLALLDLSDRDAAGMSTITPQGQDYLAGEGEELPGVARPRW